MRSQCEKTVGWLNVFGAENPESPIIGANRIHVGFLLLLSWIIVLVHLLSIPSSSSIIEKCVIINRSIDQSSFYGHIVLVTFILTMSCTSLYILDSST